MATGTKARDIHPHQRSLNRWQQDVAGSPVNRVLCCAKQERWKNSEILSKARNACKMHAEETSLVKNSREIKHQLVI
jgi:hypothetical protein